MLEFPDKEKAELPVITNPLMKEYGIFSGFTSRAGGFSRSSYQYLNLAYHIGDNRETVHKNRKLVLKAIGSTSRELFSTRQVHGNTIIYVNGNPENFKGDIPLEADCMVTDKADVPLMVLGADCCLILLADIGKKIVAAVHAGWKGTLNRLIEKVLDYLKDRFECRPGEMAAFLGPGIRKCCYSVDRDMVGNFLNEFGNTENIISERQEYYLDLPGINTEMLVEKGLPVKNIFDCHICSCCDKRFYSYRRHRPTGRQGGIIAIES